MVKYLPAHAEDIGDVGLISGLGRPPGGGHGCPPQRSCLENPVGRGAWGAAVHGVTELDRTEAQALHAMVNQAGVGIRLGISLSLFYSSRV